MEENHIHTPSFEEVHECATGDEGNKIFADFGDFVQKLDPPHQYVPWILFNDVRRNQRKKKNIPILNTPYLASASLFQVWDEDQQNQAENDLEKFLCEHYLSDVDECH